MFTLSSKERFSKKAVLFPPFSERTLPNLFMSISLSSTEKMRCLVRLACEDSTPKILLTFVDLAALSLMMPIAACWYGLLSVKAKADSPENGKFVTITTRIANFEMSFFITMILSENTEPFLFLWFTFLFINNLTSLIMVGFSLPTMFNNLINPAKVEPF